MRPFPSSLLSAIRLTATLLKTLRPSPKSHFQVYQLALTASCSFNAVIEGGRFKYRARRTRLHCKRLMGLKLECLDQWQNGEDLASTRPTVRFSPSMSLTWEAESWRCGCKSHGMMLTHEASKESPAWHVARDIVYEEKP